MSSIIALLSSALLLLNIAQSTPNLPPSFRAHAIEVAQEAITAANLALIEPRTQGIIDFAPLPVSGTLTPPRPILAFVVQPRPLPIKKLGAYFVYPGRDDTSWKVNGYTNQAIETCTPSVQNNTHVETGYIWEVFPGTYSCTLTVGDGKAFVTSEAYSFVVGE